MNRVDLYVNFKYLNDGIDDFIYFGSFANADIAINYISRKYSTLYKKNCFKIVENVNK